MKRLIPFFLLLLLLTGCTLGEDYLSVTPHVEQNNQVVFSTETAPLSVVGNRLELRGAILSMIENWKEQDTILIRNYEGDVALDLNEVMDYATRQHPTGAYAVDYADAQLLEEQGQQMVQVSFVFRRSISEINSIVLVDSSDDAYTKITEALNNFSTSLTLRIRRYSNRDFTEEIIAYCMGNPRTIPCIPEISLKLYPESGDHRILELHLAYPESREAMREKILELETTFLSAISYGEGGSTPSDQATRLCHYLIRRQNQMLVHTAPDFPVYSLLAEKKGHDLSYAICYNDLCSSLGISCRIVEGTKDGLPYYWNLLVFGDEIFHVDLRRYVEQGLRTMLPLYDEDLLAEGYEWDRTEYPAAPNPAGVNEDPTETSDSESEIPSTVPTPEPTEPKPTETDGNDSTETTLPTTESVEGDPNTVPTESSSSGGASSGEGNPTP